MIETKVRDFLKRAKTLAKNEESKQLLKYFEEYVELRQMSGRVGFDDQAYKQKLLESHRTFWRAYTKLAERHGMSPREVTKKVLEAHRFRQDHVQSNDVSSVKKLKRNKNKIKA